MDSTSPSDSADQDHDPPESASPSPSLADRLTELTTSFGETLGNVMTADVMTAATAQRVKK